MDYELLTCGKAHDHVGGLRAGRSIEVAPRRVIVGQRESVQRLGNGPLRDLFEPVAVNPEVVGEALELVGAELLQGEPLTLGKLKINLSHFDDNQDY